MQSRWDLTAFRKDEPPVAVLAVLWAGKGRVMWIERADVAQWTLKV